MSAPDSDSEGKNEVYGAELILRGMLYLASECECVRESFCATHCDLSSKQIHAFPFTETVQLLRRLGRQSACIHTWERLYAQQFLHTAELPPALRGHLLTRELVDAYGLAYGLWSAPCASTEGDDTCEAAAAAAAGGAGGGGSADSADACWSVHMTTDWLITDTYLRRRGSSCVENSSPDSNTSNEVLSEGSDGRDSGSGSHFL